MAYYTQGFSYFPAGVTDRREGYIYSYNLSRILTAFIQETSVHSQKG